MKLINMLASTKQVAIFYQDGCPACHEYLPRFRRIAAKYRAAVAIKGANMARAEGATAADTYTIEAAPTTLILDASGRVLKREEGAIDDTSIEAFFAEALKP